MPHRRPWSELSLLLCAVTALLIAAAVASAFGAKEAWLLVALLAGAYALSRGASRNDWPAREAAPLRIRATLPEQPQEGERGAAEVVVSEEQLQVDKRAKARERVRLRKEVVTEHVTITVPLRREVVRLERVPIEPGTAPEGDALTAFTGHETQDLILMEEKAVVDKRVVPRERVRLTKDVVTEEQHITRPVLREEVDVDHRPAGEPDAEGAP